MPGYAVTVVIESDDPRIDPENCHSAADYARARRVIIENLPKLTRVVSIMPEELSRMMFAAHEVAVALAGHDTIKYPPASYVPPTRD